MSKKQIAKRIERCYEIINHATENYPCTPHNMWCIEQYMAAIDSLEQSLIK